MPEEETKLMDGITLRMLTGCGKLYVTINYDKKSKTYEILSQMSKAGGCASSNLEAVCNLANTFLKNNGNLADVIDSLKGIRCPSPYLARGNVMILSCSDAIAKALELYLDAKK